MIWTAFILGVTGSLHCIGMCSPLAMAVTAKAIVNRLLYNMGRIFTYGAMGAIMASIGYVLPIAKYQNLLSLILGLTLIAIGLAGVSHSRIKIAVLSRLNIVLKKLFAHFLKNRNPGTNILLGVLNGLLPCGLTFLALSYCIILPAPIEGFAFMLLFGLGTLPALVGFSEFFQRGVRRFSINSQKITASISVISGILLVVRLFLIHMPHAHSVATGMTEIVICGK
ncbi:membrane protein [Cytophagales bacterium WSM2-2]|nr:membrane protein [Cytophagales bacterium WSM2-2]